MLTLILEDGTGRADANSYASRAQGDAYHDGVVSAATWTAASNTVKEAALVMATRLVDVVARFGGTRAVAGQALQWPRMDCPDLSQPTVFFDSNLVPACVRDAVCETARRLIAEDRTGDADGAGLKSLNVDGSIDLVFDPEHRRPMLPEFVQLMLERVGTSRSASSGVVKLQRC